MANFQLDGLKALGVHPAGDLRRGCGAHGHDGKAERNLAGADQATEQLIDGGVERAAKQVEEGHFEAGPGERVAKDPAQAFETVADLAGIFAQQAGGEVLFDEGLGTVAGFAAPVG